MVAVLPTQASLLKLIPIFRTTAFFRLQSTVPGFLIIRHGWIAQGGVSQSLLQLGCTRLTTLTSERVLCCHVTLQPGSTGASACRTATWLLQLAIAIAVPFVNQCVGTIQCLHSRHMINAVTRGFLRCTHRFSFIGVSDAAHCEIGQRTVNCMHFVKLV